MSNDPTTSQDISKDTPRLQSSLLSPTDSDPDNCGILHSASDPDPQTSRRTSIQSVLGRMTDGGRTTSILTTHDRRASSVTFMQRAETALSKLLKPKRKVGKAPEFMRQLRTILFGSCVPYSPIFPSVRDVLISSNRG